MIVVRSAGRLGNQLFVYSALMKLKSEREQLLLVGFEDLVAHFPEVRPTIRHIPLPRKYWGRWDFARAILSALAFVRVVSVISADGKNRCLMRRRGVLPLSLFDGGWCQDEKLIQPTLISSFLDHDSTDRETLSSDATTKLGGCDTRPRFFVHIRRGDYMTWPSVEHPAALPESWYLDAMRTIRKAHPDAAFLIFSDDERYAEQFARKRKNTVAMHVNPRETLETMSTCAGGILSASSFSWWGAQVASQNSPGLFLAPHHWITWPEKRWDSSHSLQDTSFITWLPVSSRST